MFKGKCIVAEIASKKNKKLSNLENNFNLACILPKLDVYIVAQKTGLLAAWRVDPNKHQKLLFSPAQSNKTVSILAQ